MLSKISSITNFGALKYAPGETKKIIQDEFDTPALKQAAKDTFERISAASDAQSMDVVLTARDYKQELMFGKTRLVEIKTVDDYTSGDKRAKSLDVYSRGLDGENTHSSSIDDKKLAELARFEKGVIEKLQETKPSVKPELENLDGLFD